MDHPHSSLRCGSVGDPRPRTPFLGDIMEPKWLVWAREIQATAQTGLAFSKDPFDRQRYERLQRLAATIMAECAGIEQHVVENLFEGQNGYVTPKVDVRAAVFRDNKILLVQERSDP